MEIALANFFNYRVHHVVPNVSYGMFSHECDLLILTSAGYAWEVEIKTSLSDLKADRKKSHNHNNKRISRLYFAIPEKLRPHVSLIPDRAGVIVVNPDWAYDQCELIRTPERVNNYRFKTDEIISLLRLSTMRIWGLKRTIERYKKEK